MIEYRTVDTNQLAPYPNMTADDLQDFEDWTRGVDREQRGSTAGIGLVLVGLVVIVLLAVS